MVSTGTKARYERFGYFVGRKWVNESTIARLRHATADCIADGENDPGLVTESDGVTLRGLHGGHLRNEEFMKLCRNPRFLDVAKEIIGGEVYVHQFKLSVKAAFLGDVWEWHQDFTFYHCEDELPTPAMVTIALFIDDVSEFNGPLIVIPHSHSEGFVDSMRNVVEEHDDKRDWLSNTTAKLRYTVARERIKKLVDDYGLDSPKGRAGDVVVFHPFLFHASGSNVSPFDRKVIFISYNSVSNLPKKTREPRPEFLAARDFRALTPLVE